MLKHTAGRVCKNVCAGRSVRIVAVEAHESGKECTCCPWQDMYALASSVHVVVIVKQFRHWQGMYMLLTSWSGKCMANSNRPRETSAEGKLTNLDVEWQPVVTSACKILLLLSSVKRQEVFHIHGLVHMILVKVDIKLRIQSASTPTLGFSTKRST